MNNISTYRQNVIPFIVKGNYKLLVVISLSISSSSNYQCVYNDCNKNTPILLFLLFFLCNTEDQTDGIMHARQAPSSCVVTLSLLLFFIVGF